MSNNYNIALDCLITIRCYNLPFQELKHLFLTEDEALKLSKSTGFTLEYVNSVFNVIIGEV